MKAKELMIGDWVHILEKIEPIINENAQITAVGIDWIDFTCANGNDAAAYESAASPIPLTEDILKANGFETSSLGLVLYPKGRFLESGQESMEFVNILLRKDGTPRSIEIDVFRYHFQCDYKLLFVHELQLALRLCGLNDLADNFKI